MSVTMDKIRLTKDLLMEILDKQDDPATIETYYNAALKDQIEADQYAALVGLLMILVKHH